MSLCCHHHADDTATLAGCIALHTVQGCGAHQCEGARFVCERCRDAGFPHEALGKFPHCGHLICGFEAKSGYKKPHAGGTPDGLCELCYAEVVEEMTKRLTFTAEGAPTPFDTFLKKTVPAVFAESPWLKPKVVVDKAVARWKTSSENPDYADVVEEMGKRASAEDAAFNAFLEKTVPAVFAENPGLKAKIILDKAVAMWDGLLP